MKLAFWGTPVFAEIVLSELLKSGLTPELVICNPDRPVGRKKIITPPPVKVLAEKNSLKVLQPEKPIAILDQLSDFDVFVVAAYAKILPKNIVELPSKGTLGVHPSLLPKYRGSSPIQSAILNCEKETGTTIYLLDEKMDHGPIIAQEKLPIDGKDYLELQSCLAELGGRLLAANLQEYLSGDIPPQVQDESEATFTKKFETEDGFVSPQDLQSALNGEGELSEKLWCKIRGLNPEPGVYTFGDGLSPIEKIDPQKRVKLLKADLQGGKLKLRTIQIEGKTPRDLV